MDHQPHHTPTDPTGPSTTPRPIPSHSTHFHRQITMTTPHQVQHVSPQPNPTQPNPTQPNPTTPPSTHLDTTSHLHSPTPISPSEVPTNTQSPIFDFTPTSPSPSSTSTDEPITHTPTPIPTPTPTPTPSSLPTRTRKPNPKYYNSAFVNHTTTHSIPPTLEPSTYQQALKDPEWRKAMDNEFNALLKKTTWELVPPSQHKPNGCKWVFRVKRHPDGSIDKYKARLVAKSFLQEYGKDYFETFSFLTKPVTIRTILTIALSQSWPIRQLDVNNAFLHGTLHEDVYMTQPPGYVNPDLPHHLCCLKKSLYGIKQAPRAWYMELTSFLLELGFRKSLADTSLFIYKKDDIVSYFLVYVDDIVLTSSDDAFVQHIIHAMSKKFSIKDLGMLHHFLGMEVISTTNGLFLSQHAHVQNILTKFKMEGAKPVATPLSSTEPLSPVDGSPSVDPTPYRQLVGSL
ncbi:putative RNA-directed DNA polymerase [Helianthus debilis subsp. tardiflorus]